MIFSQWFQIVKEVLIDPIYLIPMLTSTLMCVAASLVGVMVFLRKRSLLGEAISHSAYPGIAIGVLVQAIWFSNTPFLFPLWVLGGALVSSYLGLRSVGILERKLHLSSDSALCFVLSVSLGIGVLLASVLQTVEPIWLGRIQVYLYGQMATLMTFHLAIYSALTVISIVVLTLLFHPLKAFLFDQTFSKTTLRHPNVVNIAVMSLLLLAILVGMRSVGVILMAGMLIAPAVAARQFAKSLSSMFCLAGLFGVVSSILGNFLSVAIPIYAMHSSAGGGRVVLPTGPMILIVAITLCLGALLFAKERGFVPRLWRRQQFSLKCIQENILKAVYKLDGKASYHQIKKVGMNQLLVVGVLTSMRMKGLLLRDRQLYALTPFGEMQAKKIIRLHRLWEVYLHNVLDYDVDFVHKSAEEMEHVLTQELEADLVDMLDDPLTDPHDQIIPQLDQGVSGTEGGSNGR